MYKRTKKDIERWKCVDCKKDTYTNDEDYYMVQFDLWKKHGVGKNMLCMKCFEIRLGRPLTKKDFTNCPVNNINPKIQKLCQKPD